jgi:predicted RNA methylase
VEAADADLGTGGAEAASEVEGARMLIGLDADQRHRAAAAGCGDSARDALRPHPRVGLVDGRDDDVDIVAEHPPLGTVESAAIQRRQRIRVYGRAQPLDDTSSS